MLNFYLMMGLLGLAAAKPEMKINWRVIAFGCGLVVFLLALLVYSYAAIGRDASFILTRIALQGQLLWGIIDIEEVSWVSGGGCFLGCEGFVSGAQHLTYALLPTYLYEFYLRGGNSLSGFYPALSVYSFGIGGAFVITAFFALILGWLQGYLVAQMRSGAILFAFFVFKIYVALMLFFFAGDLGVFNNSLFLLSVALVFFMCFLLSVSSVSSKSVG